MPREIIRINVTSEFPMEPGARFLATIAYPDDRNARERYYLALCRLYVLAGAQNDLGQANKPLLIIPAIFVSSDHDCLRALQRGNNKLMQRFAAARWLLMPHLREEKLKPLQVEKDGDFIVPTLNKMTLLAMEELGWRGKAASIPTFKSKIWAPTRPVVHAAAAYVLYRYHAKRIVPVDQRVYDPYLIASLQNPSTMAALIRKSEAYRLMLADIEQFKIKEEETVQILAEGIAHEFGDSRPAESNL